MSGHPNLDPRINRRIEQSEKDGGLFLESIPERHIVNVHTQNSLYEVAIIDRKSGDAVIRGGSLLPQAETAMIRGSTWGGSMVKVKWIGIGMRFEFITPTQGLVSTSSVKSIVVMDNPELWRSMIDHAEKHSAKFATREEVEDGVRKFLAEKFSGKEHGTASQIVERFSTNGKVAIASLLVSASENSKLDDAVELIEKFWSEHWAYQAPEVRGDPTFSSSNAAYIQRAYQELNLPLA